MDLDIVTNSLPCETESIHAPGYIQGYGFLVAFEKASEEIIHVSENIRVLIGFPAEKILNHNFFQVFEKSLSIYVKQAIYSDRLNSPRTSEITSYTGDDNKNYLVIGHYFNGAIILEFEPEDTVVSFHNSFTWLDNTEQKLRESKSLKALLGEALKEMQDLIGFDRLMIYKFHEDGHGEVVAEQKKKRSKRVIWGFIILLLMCLQLPGSYSLRAGCVLL